MRLLLLLITTIILSGCAYRTNQPQPIVPAPPPPTVAQLETEHWTQVNEEVQRQLEVIRVEPNYYLDFEDEDEIPLSWRFTYLPPPAGFIF
jgi:hypothetical protein